MAASPLSFLQLLVLVTALALAGWSLWSGQQLHERMRQLEGELVRRQEDSGVEARQAAMNAIEAQRLARETAAKTSLLDARVGDVNSQRAQVDAALANLSRSREDDVATDLEAALRVAHQQSDLLGSSAPLIEALRGADERLTRLGQARFLALQQAVQRDLATLSQRAAPDLATLAVRLDQAMLEVDALPLRHGSSPALDAAGPEVFASAVAPGVAASGGASGAPEGKRAAAAKTPMRAASALGGLAASPPGADAAAPPAAALASAPARSAWREAWRAFWTPAWDEVRKLVRVSSIEQPELVLLSPEQAWFLRENLKLRLLNARLALLARQFEVVQTDLSQAEATVTKYFEPAAPRTARVLDLLGQMRQQALAAPAARAEQTLSYLEAAGAARAAAR